MEPVVPPEITAELTQILANLVLGDNEIRSKAEKAVNDRLAHTPDLYLLALAQFAIAADTEVMRSFSLVLLRRLLFRSPPQSHHTHTQKDPRITLYDHMPNHSLSNLERLLLHSLSHEPSDSVRRKTVDTVCDLANTAMNRGRPWHALQAQAFHMTQAELHGFRECAFRVFSGCPNLVMDLQTDAVLSVFEKGLRDTQSVDVRLAALRACVSYLSASDIPQLTHSLSLVYPMLDTLPPLPNAHLKTFLSSLTPLCTSHPQLFAPHMSALLSFFRALIMPSADPGPTPTVAKPFPGTTPSFSFPPQSQHAQQQQTQQNDEADAEAEDNEKEQVRRIALELMISLSEARPSMVKRVEGWTVAVVRACLEGMAELPEDGLEVWLDADPSEDPTDDTYPLIYDQALDRFACALGGKEVLPPAFQCIPSMLASYDWRQRHAGLMAIAAIAEGTSKIMQIELGKVVALVTPMFKDAHPRVRYAASQCLGQLCTDLEEIIQEKHHQQLFSALIPTLEAPEHRVHAHAAAALINFCEGVEHDTLIPYLDPIMERLLKMLDASSEKCYCQEQAITSLAMVADASETTFEKYYGSIMPLLLSVLQNAHGTDHLKLRVKAMECAGLIAIAVRRDIFRPDARPLVDALIHIQNSPVDSSDTMLATYLIATWAKICQALGQEFEPYLPVVMPPLLNAASAKADVSIYDEDETNYDREGWETISMDGQIVGIRTSTIEEKCQAFDTLVIYCNTLGPRFGPYLSQSLELALPALLFYFHEGVREAACRLIPLLLSCGKTSGTLTAQMVTASLHQLVKCLRTEPDPSFVGSLYRSTADTLRVVGMGLLTPDLADGLLDATKAQLTTLAERRKIRSSRVHGHRGADEKPDDDDQEEIALLEEMEEFALEDMEKTLRLLDVQHPLLIAVASVRDLGIISRLESEEEGPAEQC